MVTVRITVKILVTIKFCGILIRHHFVETYNHLDVFLLKVLLLLLLSIL